MNLIKLSVLVFGWTEVSSRILGLGWHTVQSSNDIEPSEAETYTQWMDNLKILVVSVLRPELKDTMQ